MAVAREPLRGLGKPESGSELKRLAEGPHNKAQIKPPAPGTRTGPRRPPGVPRAPQGPQPIGPGGQGPRGGPQSPVPKTPNPLHIPAYHATYEYLYTRPGDLAAGVRNNYSTRIGCMASLSALLVGGCSQPGHRPNSHFGASI